MREEQARSVMLMAAVETSDVERRLLSEEDRRHATRGAADLAHWDQTEAGNAEGAAASLREVFLIKRAQLLLQKLAERHPAFASFNRQRPAWPLLGMGLPVLALLLGFAADRIADPHRVDLLSPPLLGIVAWNLLIYLGLLLSLLRRRSAPSAFSPLRLVQGLALQAPRLRRANAALAAALLRFQELWIAASARLTSLRARRVLHLASAGFSIGAIASLYLRGLFSAYRVGWESTFLDAVQVHALLKLLFAPVLALLPLQGFSLEEVSALRFGSGMTGEADGARWVHLYAATIFLLAVLPRLLLAMLAGWSEQRLQARFPLELNTPYYLRLTRAVEHGRKPLLRVLPYSYTLDEARQRALDGIAENLLGTDAAVMLRPSISYGEAANIAAAEESAPSLTALLVNIAATPERENHGAVLDGLSAALGQHWLVLLDESAFAQRLAQPGSADGRLQERVRLWQQFCALHEARCQRVNLLQPDAYREELENVMSKAQSA